MDTDYSSRPKDIPDVYDNKTANPCKVHVASLCTETTNDGLRKYFEGFGEVVDAVVMKNWQTGFSRRFGFVTFKNSETVERVLQTSHVLDGKTIEVTRAVVKGLVHVRSGKIYVAALPFEVTVDELKGYFSAFGSVESAEVILNRDTGRSRGFGFVTFHDVETARTVLTREHLLRDRKVVVKAAEPKGFDRGPMGGGRGGFAGRGQSSYRGGYPPQGGPHHGGYGYEGYGYQRGRGSAYDDYQQQAAAEYMGAARGYDERAAYGRGYHPYSR
uniref:RRM domain-containing protein n=1 Tax=Paramoeba aestuarina TaxID=180227 RepID=A0A7S4JU30_9EUKA|mmetsp:Transcript_13109/g.20202  ORF Transcript_13109/g.20202 Transcript_13109/m.20202 type:complete len:272 (+) Transcript_13109:94-909(+)